MESPAEARRRPALVSLAKANPRLAEGQAGAYRFGLVQDSTATQKMQALPSSIGLPSSVQPTLFLAKNKSAAARQFSLKLFA